MELWIIIANILFICALLSEICRILYMIRDSLIENDNKEEDDNIVNNNKIIIIDKKGNKQEFPLDLNNELKQGERIFKEDGVWYIQKIIDIDFEFKENK